MESLIMERLSIMDEIHHKEAEAIYKVWNLTDARLSHIEKCVEKLCSYKNEINELSKRIDKLEEICTQKQEMTDFE